jgi:hypothetical protein
MPLVQHIRATDWRSAAILEMTVSNRRRPGGQTQFAVRSLDRNRKLLILKRRDVRVVEGARLESEAGERHQAAPKRVNAHPISDLTYQNYRSVWVGKPRCSSRFQA